MTGFAEASRRPSKSAGHHAAHPSKKKMDLAGMEMGEELARHEERTHRFKEFKRGFEKDAVVQDMTHPHIRKRCNSMYTICATSVAILMLAIGIALIAISSAELSRNRSASQAKCKITEYTAPAGKFVSPTGTWQDICNDCAFIVQGRTLDGVFVVNGWTPPFGPTYENPYAFEMLHDEFQCCPMKPSLDCCKFFHPPSSSFCDNWGEFVKSDCPSNPWPCYILDLESKMADGGNINPADLQVGYAMSAYPMFIAGAAMTAFGAFLLVCSCPWLKSIWRKNCHRLDLRLAMSVPSCLRSQHQSAIVDRTRAASRIQRAWRRHLRLQHHKKHHRAGSKAPPPQAGKLPRASFLNRMMGKSAATSPAEGDEEQAIGDSTDAKSKLDQNLSLFADEVEVIRHASKEHKKHAKFGAQFHHHDHHHDHEHEELPFYLPNEILEKVHDAEVNPQIGLAFLEPAPPSASIGGRLLYDTGSVADFRKLVKHRIATGPFDKEERVEVAITNEAEELAKFLIPSIPSPQKGKVPASMQSDARWRVGNIPKESIVTNLGLVPGLRLHKVGRLQYPHADPEQMMEALLEGPKPVFLIFLGLPRPCEHPHFCEPNFVSEGHPPLPLTVAEPPASPAEPVELCSRQPQVSSEPVVQKSAPLPPKEAPPSWAGLDDGAELAKAVDNLASRRSLHTTRPCSGPVRSSASRSSFKRSPQRRSGSFPMEAGSRETVEVTCLEGRRIASSGSGSLLSSVSGLQPLDCGLRSRSSSASRAPSSPSASPSATRPFSAGAISGRTAKIAAMRPGSAGAIVGLRDQPIQPGLGKAASMGSMRPGSAGTITGLWDQSGLGRAASMGSMRPGSAGTITGMQQQPGLGRASTMGGMRPGSAGTIAAVRDQPGLRRGATIDAMRPGSAPVPPSMAFPGNRPGSAAMSTLRRPGSAPVPPAAMPPTTHVGRAMMLPDSATR